MNPTEDFNDGVCEVYFDNVTNTLHRVCLASEEDEAEFCFAPYDLRLLNLVHDASSGVYDF